jgi:hypothetical protein
VVVGVEPLRHLERNGLNMHHRVPAGPQYVLVPVHSAAVLKTAPSS